ncbi:MAG: hypothetical protein ACREKL_08445 [Chthoniobacterales bacterium]
MTDKTLVGIGAAAVVTPLAALLYFGGFGSGASKPAETPKTPVAASAVPASKPSVSVATPTLQAAPPPKVVNQPVTPALLETLAQSVQLNSNESEASGNKKKLWAKALPVAEALAAHSDADCEEHNWLVRFVECGQQALADSPDYYSSANSLATMPRDQQEAQTGQPSN